MCISTRHLWGAIQRGNTRNCFPKWVSVHLRKIEIGTRNTWVFWFHFFPSGNSWATPKAVYQLLLSNLDKASLQGSLEWKAFNFFIVTWKNKFWFSYCRNIKLSSLPYLPLFKILSLFTRTPLCYWIKYFSKDIVYQCQKVSSEFVSKPHIN
jgi:hypothetical protein